MTVILCRCITRICKNIWSTGILVFLANLCTISLQNTFRTTKIIYTCQLPEHVRVAIECKIQSTYDLLKILKVPAGACQRPKIVFLNSEDLFHQPSQFQNSSRIFPLKRLKKSSNKSIILETRMHITKGVKSITENLYTCKCHKETPWKVNV